MCIEYEKKKYIYWGCSFAPIVFKCICIYLLLLLLGPIKENVKNYLYAPLVFVSLHELLIFL